MDGDLIQGTLQSLLQNRQQLAGQQQQAQQQHLDTMRTPLPQTSPIQAMVSDYLTKYAANPTMSWSAAAAAVGGQPERERVGLTSQLARQEAADAQAAKYAGENLKEADLFGSKLTAATRAGKGAGVTVKMDNDGNMVVYDPTTKEARTVHASQRGEYQRIWSKAYEKAVQEDMENPEGYAANVASKVLAGSPGFNPQKQPLQGGVQPTTEAKPKAETGLPKFEPLPEIPGLTPFDPNKVGLQVPAGQGSPDINKLSPVEQQMAAALKAGTGMAQNPATAQAGTQMLQGLQSQFPRPEQGLIKPQAAPSLPPAQQPQPVPQAPRQGVLPPAAAPGAPETMGYRDVRTKEQEKGYGKEEGQELFKERKALDTLYGANSKLIGQLNMLENIYKNPNIPEGELAGQISAFRSGMKSLGVDVSDKAGLTDLAKAVSTGLALTQRTADGQNLLPGQMSNYEDQLLQKMAPTLNLTNQGRLALIGMMRQIAQSNLRIAEEGTKMAAGNKDMLPSAWYQRKERVMLEEQAKMKAMADQLIKQYGGK